MSTKVIVITGASGGIGAAAGRLLASRGASLVLVARREKELHAVEAECGANVLAVVADATKRAEVQRVVKEALQHFGTIDVWINNVGRGITRVPSQLTDADVTDMLQVNVLSALYGMQEVLPHFKERRSGQIVNISSMLGRMPAAVFRSAYSGSKHFLNSLTANLRDELRTEYPGIRVTLVSPGVVATDFGTNALHGGPDSRSLPNWQTAEQVAEVIASVIDSGRDDVYTLAGGKARVMEYLSALTSDA